MDPMRNHMTKERFDRIMARRIAMGGQVGKEARTVLAARAARQANLDAGLIFEHRNGAWGWFPKDGK